ncbi:helix-turn-helix transcriptional regulator [Yersinia alsatica]|uniref:helix-turn-helix transcriptional regulator n=1 Tax=Yersinia alsatica TaxID=2890317 RepID=UPI0011A43F08|nr:AraC family transcriptional regulator [Yersinia alsatica]
MAKDKFITHSFPDVLCWIENNIHRGIKSTDVVAITGYSRSYFLREFQLAIGVSLSQYIREQRLRISASKLTWTNLTVREISEEMGFPSQSTFCQTFKTYFNISPSEYRYNSKLL